MAASVSILDLWHKRLGHLYVSKLQSLHSVLCFLLEKLITDFHCKNCHLAKQKHLLFVSNNKISDSPFDLVHVDVWGPFSTHTNDGYRYFLTIVDDCSRATWVYVLKAKSDVLIIFPSFVTIIETQFDRKK